MEKIENAKRILEKYNQYKILKLLENVDEQKKEKLSDEIAKVDFEKLQNLYKNINIDKNLKQKIEPVKSVDKNELDDKEIERLSEIGRKVIKANKYAVVTMAGGQGTRLGFNGPKGSFKLDIGEKGKYIFEILTDTLKRANKKYDVEVYWYIMTSKDNNDETISFFDEHNYFGYNREKIKFFKQEEFPLLDFDGNILINKNFEVKKASNGNGGIYKSLKNSGMIEDMRKNHVEWIYTCGVDNIMVNMVDPLLLGLTIDKNMLSGSKSIMKSYPEEKVGVFCKKDGKIRIIEYMEMPDEMLYEKDENNQLLYGESWFISDLYNIDVLEEISKHDLKYHVATKKNSYVDINGNEVIPDRVNSYKFEQFIFDGFEYSNDKVILRVNRNEEFAPIKNKTGIDSPETAKEIYNKFFGK